MCDSLIVPVQGIEMGLLAHHRKRIAYRPSGLCPQIFSYHEKEQEIGRHQKIEHIQLPLAVFQI